MAWKHTSNFRCESRKSAKFIGIILGGTQLHIYTWYQICCEHRISPHIWYDESSEQQRKGCHVVEFSCGGKHVSKWSFWIAIRFVHFNIPYIMIINTKWIGCNITKSGSGIMSAMCHAYCILYFNIWDECTEFFVAYWIKSNRKYHRDAVNKDTGEETFSIGKSLSFWMVVVCVRERARAQSPIL